MRVPNEDDWVKHTKTQYVSRPVEASAFESGTLEGGRIKGFKTEHGTS